MSILDLCPPDDLKALLEYATPEERAYLERQIEREHLETGDPWEWLRTIFPAVVTAPFAPHHAQFWAWLWAIESGERPDPFVGVWPRGGAKSSSAEAACVALGARQRRKYVLYVCGTQEQADDHVGNVAGLLERPEVDIWYPDMAKRLVGKFGNPRGWRRNRVRTASGFTVDAIGLDTASRGAKLDDQRPDLIVIDDIDDHDDSPRAVRKKIDLLTKALIPAGAPDVAVLAIQNLVHREGVFARLVDGRADFLARRIVSGPVPALVGLVTEHRTDEHGRGRDVVVAGVPSWVGQSVDTCQEQIDDWGLSAFLAEAQHDVRRSDGTLWVPEQLARIRCAHDDVPAQFAVVNVSIDPSGGDGPDNDEQGIVVCARDHRGDGWVLDDVSCRLSPAGWGDRAVRSWVDWEADRFVCEANYGGDMAIDVLKSAVERALGEVLSIDSEVKAFGRLVRMRVRGSRDVAIHVVHASRGKRVRAEPVAALYGRPDDPATWSTSRVHHAGHLPQLEDEMTTWRADSGWSPNRLDACVWGLTDLLIDAPVKGRRRSVVASGVAA